MKTIKFTTFETVTSQTYFDYEVKVSDKKYEKALKKLQSLQNYQDSIVYEYIHENLINKYDLEQIELHIENIIDTCVSDTSITSVNEEKRK